jgi:hypothetical protein
MAASLLHHLMNWQERVDLVTNVVLNQWSHMRTCQCQECKMSANLNELEAEKTAPIPDSEVKAELEKLLNRYIPMYRYSVAKKEFDDLIEMARKNR